MLGAVLDPGGGGSPAYHGRSRPPTGRVLPTVPATAAATSPTESGPTDERPGPRAALAVLAALPIAVFVGMRVQPMARVMSIDPTLYTAYIEDGPDLIDRFGTDRYYWSRVGMVLPGRLTNMLFGPVGGFYVFRYLLAAAAIVPAYVLFTRLWGRRAGLLAALVLLVNPVALRAATSDYPDGAAIAYLVGASCCLVIPTIAAAPRWRWLLASGALFTMAVHCNLVIGALVAATVGSYALVVLLRGGWSGTWRRLLVDGAVLGGVFVVGTLGLAVLAEVFIGAGNLAHPNRVVLDEMSAGLLDKYHSTNWRWVLRETQLAVLPIGVASWAVLRLRTRSEPPVPVAEQVLVLSAAAHLVGFTLWQFVNGGSTLENHLYSSMLWASGSLVAALVLRALLERLPTPAWAGAAAAAVVVGPLLVRRLDPDLHFRLWPWAPLIGLVVVAALLLARAATRLAGRPPVVLGLVGLVVVASYSLTVAKPQGLPFLEGQAVQPQASYGDVFLNDDATYLDTYRIITQLPDLVPDLDDTPGRVATWWSGDAPDVVQYAGAMFLWRNSALMGFDFVAPGLPVLGDAEQAALSADPPRFVLMLGVDATRFDAGLAALEGAATAPEVLEDRVLRSGSTSLAVRLVELGSWSPEGDGGGGSA
jgi:hypothetical protein